MRQKRRSYREPDDDDDVGEDLAAVNERLDALTRQLERMRGERLRLLLGLLVLAVGLRFAFQLVVQPDDLYSIRMLGAE